MWIIVKTKAIQAHNPCEPNTPTYVDSQEVFYFETKTSFTEKVQEILENDSGDIPAYPPNFNKDSYRFFEGAKEVKAKIKKTVEIELS